MKKIKNVDENEGKGNDERGIRTPEMQSITGLAILRHTGLGYLVIQVVEDAIPLNAFQIFNLFWEKQFKKLYFQSGSGVLYRVKGLS